jgi:hypothetical protein
MHSMQLFDDHSNIREAFCLSSHAVEWKTLGVVDTPGLTRRGPRACRATMAEYILGAVLFSKLALMRSREGPGGRPSLTNLSRWISTGCATSAFPETEERVRVVRLQRIRMANNG